MEYRIFDLKASTDEMIVEGYATVFNRPYLLHEQDGYSVYEQIDRNAFDKCDMDNVIMQFDHAGQIYARTKNGTLKVKPDNYGLKVWANLGGTNRGQELYKEIKGKYITQMSFGFKVDKAGVTVEDTGDKRLLRTITAIAKLYDVSAVSIPANDATEINARNAGMMIIENRRKEQVRAIKDLLKNEL